MSDLASLPSPEKPISELSPLPSEVLPTGIRARFVSGINGLRVHILEAGSAAPGRPAVLLLHGFPELAYSWRKIMPTLAAAGFHGVSGYWHGIRNQDRSIQDDHPDDDQAATDTSGLIP